MSVAGGEEAAPPKMNGAAHMFRIDASGAATALDWPVLRKALKEPREDGEWIWLHLDRSDAEARRWLETESGLSQEVLEAMLNDDTQPRADELDGGLLVLLRGRNRDASDRIADLVSTRIFMSRGLVISVRLRPFAPSWRLAETYLAGRGPATPTAFLDRMIEIGLIMLEEGLDWIGAEIDQLEEAALTGPDDEMRKRRARLNALKRAVIERRRYLRPQSNAIARLATLNADCLDPAYRSSIAEAANQTGRIVEDLEGLRERATIVADEMQARMTDRLNRTLLTLAVVSTVFLPLTVMTSLMGVNLAGIPFAERPWAFIAFVFSLAVVALASIIVVRKITQE